MDSLQQYISGFKDQLIGVAVYDLQTGRETLVHARETMHPASTIKVHVMMEVFHQAAQGRFSIDDEIQITNSFTSIVDGSPFMLHVEDDSETTLYPRLGQSERIRELMRLMIVRSSNLATNILLEKVGPQNVTAFIQELGIQDVVVRRGVEDNVAFRLGLNNSASALGLAQTMRLIAQEKVVSPQASQEMIQILLGQQFNEGIPARLPESVRVAHKTGWNDNLYHDFGIIFPEDRKPYVLGIMTRGFSQETEAHECVAEISSLVYQQLAENSQSQ